MTVQERNFFIKYILDKGSCIRVDAFFIVTLFLSIITGYFNIFIPAYFSMIIHELGHAAGAIAFGNRINLIKFLPIGLNISMKEYQQSKKQRIIIYIMGPFLNICILTFAIIASKTFLYKFTHLIVNVAKINAFLALFNLIPVLPLDGGRISLELLASAIGNKRAQEIIGQVSFIFSSIVILFGLIFSFFDVSCIFLLMIGIFILREINREIKEVSMMNMKDVIYRRSRLLKKGIYPARDLVVVKTMKMGDIIKSLDFDRFHMIHVLDENLKLLKVFTEQDIMDGVIKYDADMTFDEFIKKELNNEGC